MNKKFEKVLKVFIATALLLATVVGASASVHAWKMFGYNVGFDGIHKEEQANKVQTQEQVQVQTQVQERSRTVAEPEQIPDGDDLTDIDEVLNYANADKWTTDFMKNFAGDNFCVKTERRLEAFHVGDDGLIAQLDETPKKCTEFKSQERYLSQVWEKVQNRERVSYKDIKKNVDIPWKVKMKVAYAGFKESLT